MLFRSKDKKEAKNPKVKKANSQKFKQKKQHLCHHCGAARHTRLNCYKWLTTSKSNNMITSGDQNQFPSFFTPLGDLLKALMFLSNLNGLNSSPNRRIKGLLNGKVLPRCGRKRAPSDSITFSLSPSCFCFCIICVSCFHVLSQSSFMHCFYLTCFCLFTFQFCFILFFI